jgi:hypothetical protein
LDRLGVAKFAADDGQELIGIFRHLKGIIAGRPGDLTAEMIKTVCIHADLAWQSRHYVFLSEGP